MHRNFFARSLTVAGVALVLAAMPAARAGDLTISINTTFDTNGFFTANPTALVDLDDAAAYYESIIKVNLSAIDNVAQSAADGNNPDTWQTNTFNPSDPNNSASNIQLNNLVIANNTIVVFAGGANFGGAELGLGGPGGFSDSSFSTTWYNAVQARGVVGAEGAAASQTSFGPWGGSVAFDNQAGADWYFDPDPSANNPIPAGMNDFYSVALHELGHVLGIGTANSWKNLTVGGNFTGLHAEALNGGAPVLLSNDLGHWAQSSESDVFNTTIPQQPEMTPSLLTGTRKLVTDLDAAGLQDIGWTVVPEPAVWPWAAGCATLALCARRKKTPAKNAAAKKSPANRG